MKQLLTTQLIPDDVEAETFHRTYNVQDELEAHYLAHKLISEYQKLGRIRITTLDPDELSIRLIIRGLGTAYINYFREA